MRRKHTLPLKQILQIRFVLLATLTATLLLGTVIGIVLLRSYGQIVKKADHLLALISENPESPEIGDAHFFTVTLSPGEKTLSVDLSHTTYIHEKNAAALGRQVLKIDKAQGFLEGYRFHTVKQGGCIRILFLSRKLPLEVFKETQNLLIFVSLLGLLLTAGILSWLSGRIVTPLVEAHEKQRRFVTSASHALKTPVAVILGDAQLLQMELPDNAWLTDIENHARQMAEMTQSLVTLSRCDEGIQPTPFIVFPISDMVEELTASFQAMAASRALHFQVQIASGLSYCGDEKALREMVSILLDNAFRYCPDGGSIAFLLEKRRKGLGITVQNTAQNLRAEEVPHFMERFYRGSTSNGAPGSGLGLAIAQSIVVRHGGRLSITAPSPQEILIRVTL